MADAGYLELEEGAEPSTPSAGMSKLYVDQADGHIKKIDDLGVVLDLETVGAPPVSSVFGRTGAVAAQSGDYSAAQVSNTPAGGVVATTVQAAINELDAEKAPAAHVGSTGVTEHGVASGVVAGFMSPSDKTKLDGVASGATANDTDANLKNRANHTGTQTASTISDFSSAVDAQTATNRAPLSHVGAVGTGAHGLSTTLDAGFMSATDKLKLDGVESGATANDTDANLKNRANHTGTQLASTISDFTTAARTAVVDDAITNGVADKAPSQNAVFDALALKLTDPLTTNGDLLTRIGGVSSRLGIGTEAQLLRVVSGLPAWDDENLGQDFGDGYLGDVVLTSQFTAAGPGYFNTLTLDPGGIYITNGYPIYCKTLDLSNADAGAIRWNGNNGTSATTNSGAAAGASLTSAMFGGGTGGSNGASGTVNAAGSTSGAATNANPSNGGSGGNSGAGGAGSAGVGGASGGGAAASNPVIFGRFEQQFVRGATIILGGAGGDGGASGGGSASSAGRGGGGGGGAAGVVAIYADTLITSVSTPAGVIQAIGGNGGNGATNSTVSDVGAGGGAGGGGGGYVYVAYNYRIGPTVTSAIQCTGGNGGNGGSVTFGTPGAGLGGNGGQGGNGGRIDIYNASGPTGSHISGATGSAGSAASGVTGGNGGAGGACNGNL